MVESAKWAKLGLNNEYDDVKNGSRFNPQTDKG